MDEVRVYAWLYFLVFVDRGKLGIKSWGHDKRMGVSCSDAMKYWEEKTLVKTTETEYICTNMSVAKHLVYKMFGRYKDYDSAMAACNKFKKYTGDNLSNKYPIYTIPFDLYEYDLGNTKKEYHLTREDYNFILRWFDKYQSGQNKWATKLSKYLGKEKDLLNSNTTYKVYRGINITNAEVDKFKVGKNITIKNNISWTLSKHIAEDFAEGRRSDNWHRPKRTIKNDGYEGEVGIVVEHTFNHAEILLDIYFLCNNNHEHLNINNVIKFSEEKEVIVKPMNVNCKIVEVITK